jgi:hypothetical protein
MIVGKLAKTYDEINMVKKSMPKHGTLNALCIVGYWDNDKCIGGAYLFEHHPNELVMEFYTHCPTVIQAIGYSFSEFLKLKDLLNAKIENDNYKSLKIAKMFGFKKLYVIDGKTAVQFHKKNWRYQKRYPLN